MKSRGSGWGDTIRSGNSAGHGVVEDSKGRKEIKVDPSSLKKK
ncbi:hypothetical protein [Brumimicrobium salinarum]|nr:hypothetical protein [Brumimicrobium salinarum]